MSRLYHGRRFREAPGCASHHLQAYLTHSTAVLLGSSLAGIGRHEIIWSGANIGLAIFSRTAHFPEKSSNVRALTLACC